MPIAHHIVACSDARVIAGLPWDVDVQEAWQGVFLCQPGESDEPMAGGFGCVSSGRVVAPCLGVAVDTGQDVGPVMLQLAVACGLSILDMAGAELGDMLVVAGANWLALVTLLAARAQGLRTISLVPQASPVGRLSAGLDRAAEQVLAYDNVNGFETALDAVLASAGGRLAFVDTAGQPALVYEMAARLARYSTLVFCRQESTNSVVLRLRELHHLKSARFVYWARPETLRAALDFETFYQRAARLVRWGRLPAVDLSILTVQPTDQ